MRKWSKRWGISRRRIKKWKSRFQGCMSRCKRWVNGRWIRRWKQGWRSSRAGWMGTRGVKVGRLVVRGWKVVGEAGAQSRGLMPRCRSWCGNVGWVEPRWQIQGASGHNWSICERSRSKTWAHQRASSSQLPPRRPNSPKAPATSKSRAASRRPDNSSMPFDKVNWTQQRWRIHKFIIMIFQKLNW